MTMEKMKQRNSRWILLALVVISSIFLSSCSGGASRIAASSWPGFTVDGDTIYVSYGQTVQALRLDNGNKIWQYPVETDRTLTFYAPPTLKNGSLLVGDYTNSIHSLNAADGTLQWKFSEAQNRFIAPGLQVDDLVLMPSADGVLYAMSSEGYPAWTFEQSDESLWAQPVYDGEKVYLASMDHFLYALEVSSEGARQAWAVDLGGAMVSSPAMDENGNLFIGTMTHEMIAVSSSGKVLWRYETQGAVWATPVVHEGQVMFGDLSGTIYALNAGNGNVEWTINVDGPVIGTGALLSDGVAFGVEEAGVQAVGFNGVKLWSHPVDGDLQAGLVQAGDFVLVALTNGEDLMLALDPANGNERWSVPSK